MKTIYEKQLTMREKRPNMELFLVRIFPHSDWMGRNTKYEISLRIQSECGKIRTRNNSVFGHFSDSVSFKKTAGLQSATLY